VTRLNGLSKDGPINVEALIGPAILSWDEGVRTIVSDQSFM